MEISDGTSQRNRSEHVLDNDFFKIDELSFHDLICITKDFAKKIKFYNLNNKHEGYWDELLLTDEIVVISEIVGLDVKKIEEEYINNAKTNFEDPDQYLTRQIDLILELAEYMNSWYVQLYSIDSYYSGGLINVIDELIREKLMDKLQACRHLQQKVDNQSNSNKGITKFNKFNKIWGLDKNKEELHNDNFNSIEKINHFLGKSFYSFNNSINFLKKTASNYLDKSLKNQSHSPYLSLLITFLKLYLNARDNLNSFTKRYFQFYYNEILKIQAKDYFPDSTFLLFTLKDGVDHFYLKKGTRFIGGKDETKKKIFYSTENDIVINKAKIGKILTLYLESNELIWPKSDCTNILKDEIPLIGSAGNNPENNKNWSLFGSSINKIDGIADLGFALADKNLLLLEGQREVDIEIYFTKNSFKSFNNQLNNIKGEYLINEVFIKLFSKIFFIYVSVEDGWFKIENYIIDCSLINDSMNGNTMNIQFKLSLDDPSITSCSREIHGLEYMEGLPVVKVLINNESYLFPYSLIEVLEIEKITTTAHVKDLKKIVIFNELGQLDNTKPFYPFGVIPKLNSYFILGNYEMSIKKISNLDIYINWNNLTDDENGLQGYFKEYEVNLSKYDYKCNITCLNNGKWLPEDRKQQQIIGLFESDTRFNEGANEKLKDFIELEDIDTLYFQVDNRKTDTDSYSYDNYALGSFFRFSLSSPPFAFGHKDYPISLTKVIMDNANRKVQKLLPNVPLSPIIENMSLGYTAVSSMEFSIRQSSEKSKNKKFYHIHPWGYEDMMDNVQHKKRKLVPDYIYQGNLFIGLEHTRPNMTVSIFFNLLDDSILEVEKDPPAFVWEYLSSNQWKPLPKSNFLSDSTNEFLESGIIMIRIPGDIDYQNTILSSEYHWLRVSAGERLDAVCSVVSISTQAVLVTWENQENSLSHLESPLQALNIVKSEISLPGIKTILQVVNSFNGKPPENIRQTKIRVGERLKHKNRAVTPWDYERLILEEFPNIYKVKCIPHMSSDKMVNPGHVLIAVIENVDIDNLRIDYEPMVDNTSLHKIKLFIKKVASDFVDVEVRNPVFERVQVRCAVKFKDGLDVGYFMNQLNNELINFLTPWQTNGYNEPGFGKNIKCTDVLSFVLSFDYVDFATDFSMLQITQNAELKYSLFDTADESLVNIEAESDKINESDTRQKILKPTYPWGILISTEKHAIEIVNEEGEIEPEKTGIDELEVGGTFIIK